MGVVTLVYLMVNVSYLAVLDKEEFLSSWAVGVVSTFSDIDTYSV